MTAKKRTEPSGARLPPPPPMPTVPTIAIYQQPDHIAGLLQQLDGPLLQTERRTQGRDDEATSSSAEGGEAHVDLQLGSPGVAKLGMGLGGRADGASGNKHLTTARRELEFVYSQALYLHQVRAMLRSHGLLRTVLSVEEASALSSGDFVEFQAKFTPDQVAAALDIMTPELVQQIVRKVRTNTFAKATDFGDYEALQQAIAKFKEKLDADLALASAITTAIKADFRSDNTREYYGAVGEGDASVTAITICDADHFTVADVDRILDGRFTVLGKVSDGVEQDRPVLERNKLLDKFSPEAVDTAIESFNSTLDKGTNAVEGRLQNDSGEDAFSANPLNFRLDSRVSGPSFKVIPIAIFT